MVYALVFVAAVVQGAIVPLLPHFAHRYSLTPAETGTLLGAAALTTLLVAAPAGLLADRVGARWVTLGAAALLGVSTFGTAAASSFAALLASRLVFGAAFGIVWTTGLAWLSQTAGGNGTSRMSATVTSSAIGQIVGPAFAGLAAQYLGVAAPFWIAGGIAALITVLLAGAPSSNDQPGHVDARPLSARVRAATGDSSVLTALVALSLVGAISAALKLLIPLQLHNAGATTGAIGLVFTATAGVYILVSATTVTLGERAITVPLSILAVGGLAIVLVPAIASVTPAAAVAALLLSAIPRASLSTISYPLATRARLGDGATIGLLNAGWAASTVVSPIAIGALAGAVGSRLAYLTMFVTVALAGIWLLSFSHHNTDEEHLSPGQGARSRWRVGAVARRSVR